MAFHLKGDKHSTSAQLMQKTIERAQKEQRTATKQQQHQYGNNVSNNTRQEMAWIGKHAGFTADMHANNAEQEEFAARKHRMDTASSNEQQEQQKHQQQQSDKEKEDHMSLENDSLDDDGLAAIREKRIAALRKQQNATSEYKAKGHGEYKEIVQDEFLTAVTASKYSICHFYHKDFERCKIIDKHLEEIVGRHLPCRMIKLNVEKAPFFIQKLNIRVLPTIICFKDGVAIDRIVGFDELGKVDDFPTATLEKRLAKAGVIHLAEPVKAASLPITKFSRGNGHGNFSDDDDDDDDW